MNQAAHKFIGVDVQIARACPYAIIAYDGRPLESGWLPDADRAPAMLRALCDQWSKGVSSDVVVAIDAPRVGLPSRREWYWEGARQRWRRRLQSESGYGRHCEVMVSAHRVATPQWTPLAEAAKPWMQLGFKLFEALTQFPNVLEVFPSASYAQLAGAESVECRFTLSNFSKGPKDMLDAYVAAVTAREFMNGRGQAVGGGDGLGQIILARPLPKGLEAVGQWPDG